ncbi:hypothetical protein [Embleya sp. NPDC005971]|uniref:hypothetical protein n=1 Tax=Embleya sp. NPDC005971 TaxID=3156724 RepID=UPI0033E746AA
MTPPQGPTEIAGRRVEDVDGHRIVFYPDAANPMRPASEPGRFHWMPGRLWLGRRGTEHDFSFTRYVGATGNDPCGLVHFSLVAGIPEDVVDRATRQLFDSQPKNDPYWTSSSYHRYCYVPLTFRDTHTTLSDVAAETDPLVRRVTGVAPWYRESQGADAAPLPATGSRSYSVLLDLQHTALFHRSVVDGIDDAITVNRTMSVEFTAPVSGFTTTIDWLRARRVLGRRARTVGDVTLEDVREAVDELRSADDFTVACTLDPSVPPDEQYENTLLSASGCVAARFLQLARATILEAPDNRPTPLASDADGSANPWGPTWIVADEPAAARSSQDVLTGPFGYLRRVTVSTRFTAEFREMRADPTRYFFTRYPADEHHTLRRVFRPVLAHDNPAVESVSVCCGYPDTTGRLVWEGRVFPRPQTAADRLEPWTYGTAQLSLDDIHDPPPGWTPDRTFVRRFVQLCDGAEAGNDLCRVQNDMAEMAIDPDPEGTLLNDIAVDISLAMVTHLDVHPIRLTRPVGAEETVDATFEALDEDGEFDGRHRVTFRWEGGDDRPRRWIVFPDDPGFPRSCRYRITLRGPGTPVETRWYYFSGSGPIHLLVPR